MRRHQGLLVILSLMFITAPGPVLAGCAETVGLLAKQVDLIAASSALAADPKAPLGPGDTVFTLENPALTARTRTAFDVFAASSGKRDAAAGKLAMRLSRARVGLAQAGDALSRGDIDACEDAVSMGLAAAMGARDALH